MDEKFEYAIDEESTIKTIDEEESKKQGKIVYKETKLGNSIPVHIGSDSYSQKKLFTPFIYYFIALFLFFNIAAYIASDLVSKGKDLEGLLSSIGFTIGYALILILVSKYGFKKENYGSFISKSCKVVGANGLVIFLFLATFMIYPLYSNSDLTVKYLMKKASLFYIIFMLDVSLQVLMVYLKEKYPEHKRLINIILFAFQEISILCYLSVIIPIMFDKNIYIFIAFMVAILITLILCLTNYLVVKTMSISHKKDNRKYYLVFEDERHAYGLFALLILFFLISFIPNLCFVLFDIL